MARDESKITVSVDVTFYGIPNLKYGDFIDELESLVKDWGIEANIAVGEEEQPYES